MPFRHRVEFAGIAGVLLRSSTPVPVEKSPVPEIRIASPWACLPFGANGIRQAMPGCNHWVFWKNPNIRPLDGGPLADPEPALRCSR
jgi:hypothetical protein